MHRTPQDRPGFLQEQDGAFSYRRLQGLIYGLYALVLFTLAALHDSQWAFWAGVACTVASIVYPILTTTQEIRELVAAARDVTSAASRQVLNDMQGKPAGFRPEMEDK